MENITERALKKQEVDSINESLERLKKLFKTAFTKAAIWGGIYMLLVLIVPFKKYSYEDALLMKVGVLILGIVGYFILMRTSPIYKSIKEYNHLLLRNKIHEFSVKDAKMISYHFDKKENSAYIFQISPSKLAVLSSDYFDDENMPTDNLTITFFDNHSNKRVLYNIESSGNKIEPLKTIKGKLKKNLNLNKKYSNPYTFSMFDGNLEEIPTILS